MFWGPQWLYWDMIQKLQWPRRPIASLTQTWVTLPSSTLQTCNHQNYIIGTPENLPEGILRLICNTISGLNSRRGWKVAWRKERSGKTACLMSWLQGKGGDQWAHKGRGEYNTEGERWWSHKSNGSTDLVRFPNPLTTGKVSETGNLTSTDLSCRHHCRRASEAPSLPTLLLVNRPPQHRRQHWANIRLTMGHGHGPY